MNPAHRHEPSSSFDSEDAGSRRDGTPDTKSTALSPDEFRQGITTQGSTTTNQPPAFLLGAVPPRGPKSVTITYHDPFVTSNPGQSAGYLKDPSRIKLSPIAPAFTPLALGGATGETIVSSTLTVPMNPPRGSHYYSPSSLQSSPRMPETPYAQTFHEPYSPNVQHPPTKSGQFSSDSLVSRSVVVSHMDMRTPAADIEGLISPTKYRSRKHLVLENLPVTGTIYVSFTDLRDAIEAVRALRGLAWDWLVQYLSVPEPPVDSEQEDGKSFLAPKYEGQLLVKAEFSGPAVYFNTDTVGRLILDLLNNYGSVMAYKAISTMHPVVAYRAEFFDVKDADHAIVHLNGFRIAGCTMTIQPYRDEGPVIVGGEDSFLDERFSQMGLESGPTNSTMPVPRAPLLSPYSVASPSHNSTLTPGFVNSPTSPMFFGGLSPGFLVQQAGDGSPISRNLLSYPNPGMQTPTWSSFDATSSNPGAIGQERHTPLSSFHNPNQYPRSLVRHGGRNMPDHSSGHHNVVDVNRIRKGADVRTTIMLRNIPNKIDQAMLKDIVDETSWGRYDFMYLRIDFANNCKSVCLPYALLLDTNPGSVGYAFINFEDPYYIIEIFRTGDDPMAGSEEPFPGPDNPSKMRRSVENAEHVGLFAPRAGQNFRDEQRRRRSQYDRGTRLAEIEDSYRFNHQLSRFRHAIQRAY
ncbi:MAG: hypothetical protein Q9172_003151 [Xanthocarpia lactea]